MRIVPIARIAPTVTIVSVVTIVMIVPIAPMMLVVGNVTPQAVATIVTFSSNVSVASNVANVSVVTMRPVLSVVSIPTIRRITTMAWSMLVGRLTTDGADNRSIPEKSAIRLLLNDLVDGGCADRIGDTVYLKCRRDCLSIRDDGFIEYTEPAA